jgi:hypothetical protein
MTRLELLTIVVARARANGFEFRRWYTTRLGLPWISAEAALALLNQQRRYYALVFAHEFANAFWRAGEEITFSVPGQSYQRRNAEGVIVTVTRKPFQRRSARKNAWLYHLREMAGAEEPLRYLRRYVNIAEELEEEPTAEEPAAAASSTEPTGRRRPGPAPKPLKRPLPEESPAFLRRPYRS